MKIKFRPSSHSDDVTLVATYAKPETANKAAQLLEKFLAEVKANPNAHHLDWGPDDAEAFTHGNRLLFNVYTAGYLDEVDAIINGLKPEKVGEFIDFQEVEIEVTLPKGLTKKVTPLVLTAEEAEVIRWLKKEVGTPQTETVGEQEKLKWTYSGSGIYYGSTLVIDGREFILDQHQNWRVSFI
jgi:hypothetical protein